MQAVRHANGRDWWLLLHSGAGNNIFYKFFVDTNGIQGPFTDTIGSVLGNALGVGQMIFSPKGDKLICVDASGVIDLFDFDRCTGQISNYVELGNAPYNSLSGPYGCSFSPNNKVLYVSNPNTPDTLFQFDLTAGNIKASRQIIWINSVPQTELGQHKLASDGKIYIALANYSFPNYIFDSTNMNLCVINNPDSLGLPCNFVPYNIPLGGARCFLGLPNNPNYNLGSLTGSPCDTLTVGINEVKKEDSWVRVYPNPATNSLTLNSQLSILNSQLLITDVFGRTVYHQSITNSQTTIDISQLSNGVYFYQLSGGKETFRGKFVKE
jgi:hypothetical protein